MSDEAAEFRKALNVAGQPWSRRGVILAGIGIVALLALQLIPQVPYAFYALIVSVAVIAVGWVFLVIGVLKRRQWAKSQLIEDVPLPDATSPGAS